MKYESDYFVYHHYYYCAWNNSLKFCIEFGIYKKIKTIQITKNQLVQNIKEKNGV